MIGRALNLHSGVGVEVLGAAFNKLIKEWTSSLLNLQSQCSCRSILWLRDVEDDYKLNIFQRQCFKKILNVHWPMKVSDEEIRER